VSGLILKVLFVLGVPNPFPGAAWTRIGFFAENWSKKGHEVDVLGTFSYASFQEMGAETFGKVNILNFIFNLGIDHPLVFTINSLMSFIVSTLFLIAKRPNITVVSVPTGNVGLGALMACKLIRVKYVVDYRDEWEDYVISFTNNNAERVFYYAIKKLATRLYAKGKVIAAVTPSSMRVLKQRGLENVALITNGADVKTFKPLSFGKKNEGFTIFYSGLVGEYYRLDVVVRAIKRLVERNLNDIKLVVAGQGEIETLLRLAAELGLSSNVNYIGAINSKVELAQLVAMADVGLVPYDDNPLWKNSLPAKFYEYCACGLPVIATAHEDSLLAEFIREYRIGITSPPMNEEKLVEAIYWMYQNRIFREAAGKRARLLIEEKFDRNKIAEEFLNLLRASI
jgi:glycosyltransferase involved in cell wall biosynthesis